MKFSSAQDKIWLMKISGKRTVVQFKHHAKPVILFNGHTLEPSDPNSFLRVKGKRVLVVVSDDHDGTYEVFGLPLPKTMSFIIGELWEDETR